ncbi:MAG: isoleucine--tRNA ligase, partial [Deltaproteobacteria bacterium]|nr:isoleucine--tRNA ligase [Deltaproteobacteria bacterium]
PVGRLKFSDMEGLKARHPFIERASVILPADFVATDTGTGSVHIAPGHGQDDYALGIKHGLDIYAPVDDKGMFKKDVAGLEGLFVFKANPKIIETLEQKGALILKEDIRHSYPHCWRCKGPIIFRATEQWFAPMDRKMNKETLRERSLRAIKEEVAWLPAWGRERIYNMVASRPDWCLSRQRAWGVPIPAVICKGCGHSQLLSAVIHALAQRVEKEGADVWFERPIGEFLPPDIACPECGARGFDKEENILDVWFDSGISFHAVLEKRKDLEYPASLYLEGSDQHRGWFHSSLLASIATRGRAPYRSVLTHGFVVDGNGKKMSKSAGNVISPEEIIREYGAEVLRLWVCAEDYREDIRISKEILKRLSEAYRRIRNTIRFILGNLYDFDPKRDLVPYEELACLDRLMLHRLTIFAGRIIKAYETYEFHAIYHSTHNFCTVDLSAFYLDAIKDRLYTSKAGSPQRRSAQTVIFHTLDYLLRLLAPILVFTTDEAWGFMPAKPLESVHLGQFPEPDREWLDEKLSSRWDELLKIKTEISKALETARTKKLIGHPLDAAVTLYLSKGFEDLSSEESASFKEALIVSGLTIVKTNDYEPFEGLSNPKGIFHEADGLRILVTKAIGERCERCWNYSLSVGRSAGHPLVCSRCVEALSL